MKISIQYNCEEGSIPIMIIEHEDSIYQLYISYDYYVHLDKHYSAMFVSSTNLKSCLDCTKTIQKEREFYQNVIICGSFYEVLQKAGISKDLNDTAMKLLNAFMYSSLDCLGIKYDCQCGYLQFQNKFLSQIQRNTNPECYDLKREQIYFSAETQCVYLNPDSTEVREFNYGKYINENTEYSFVYNLICVLMQYYYPNENPYIPYEYFLSVMNQSDKDNYTDELKNKIIKALGNTGEIQNALLLAPIDLFHFLHNRLNSCCVELKFFLDKEQFSNLADSYMQTINLLSDIMYELCCIMKIF